MESVLQVVHASAFPVEAFDSLLGIAEGLLRVTTKYFDVTVQVSHSAEVDPQLKSFAVVLLTESDLRLTEDQESYLQDTEHCIVFTQEHSGPVAEAADRLGCEYASQDLLEFSGFLREDYENIGLARVKEIIELAVGSEVLAGRAVSSTVSAGSDMPSAEGLPSRSDPVHQIEELIEPDEEDEARCEADLEEFDSYMTRIKETAALSKELSDTERRERAEALITEVMRYLKIDD